MEEAKYFVITSGTGQVIYKIHNNTCWYYSPRTRGFYNHSGLNAKRFIQNHIDCEVSKEDIFLKLL